MSDLKLGTFVDVSMAGESYAVHGDLVVTRRHDDFCHVTIKLEDGTSLSAQIGHEQAIEVMLALSGFVGRRD